MNIFWFESGELFVFRPVFLINLVLHDGIYFLAVVLSKGKGNWVVLIDIDCVIWFGYGLMGLEGYFKVLEGRTVR